MRERKEKEGWRPQEQRSDAWKEGAVPAEERPPLPAPRPRTPSPAASQAGTGRALPIPAARGRVRSRRGAGGGKRGAGGGGSAAAAGAAAAAAQLRSLRVSRPRVRTGRAAPPPGCGRLPAAAAAWRSRHCSRCSPAPWVSSGRPGRARERRGLPGSSRPRPASAPRETPGGPALPRGRPRPAAAAPSRGAPAGLGSPGPWDPGARLPGPFRLAGSRRRRGPTRVFPLPSAASRRPAGPRGRGAHPHRKRGVNATARNFGWREAAAAGPPPCLPPAPRRPPRAPPAPRAPGAGGRGWRRPGSVARAPARSAPPRPARLAREGDRRCPRGFLSGLADLPWPPRLGCPPGTSPFYGFLDQEGRTGVRLGLRVSVVPLGRPWGSLPESCVFMGEN